MTNYPFTRNCPCCDCKAEFIEDQPQLGDDDADQYVFIRCSNCGLSTPSYMVNWKLRPVYQDERIRAATLWNRRP